MADIVKKRLERFTSGDWQPLMKINANAVTEDIVNHIHAQREINDEDALKQNTPKVKAYKQATGKGSRSLIWEHRLATKQAFNSVIYPKNATIQRTTSMTRKGASVDYNEIGGYLIDMGYDFWGVSPTAQLTMLKNAMAYIRNLIGAR